MSLSQDTKDVLKVMAGILVVIVMVVSISLIRDYVNGVSHVECIKAASEEGIDGPSIVLLCGKL